MSKKSQLRTPTKSTNNNVQKSIDSKSIVNEPFSSNNDSKKNYLSYLILGVILIFTYLCFVQVKNFEFVNWDDDRNLYENKNITSLNADNFWQNSKAIFTEDVIGNYNPLPVWTFAIEKMVYGSGSYEGIENAGKFHHVNLLLHLACVIFVFFIAKKLALSDIASGIVAALFALHPMHIESFAWVTERKDVLFGLFYLIAMYLYIINKSKPSFIRTLFIVVCFVLSLLSKIQAVSLPLSFMAIDYLLDKKFEMQQLYSKWFYFLLSIAFGLIGVFVLKDEGSLEGNNYFELWQRIFIGSYSFCVYLIKFIFPYEMSPLYAYPAKLSTWHYVSFIILPITLFGIYKAYKKQWYFTIFAIVFFIVNIIFLLQILGAGQAYLADRFSYIAYLGFFIGIGFLFDYVHKNKSNYFVGASIIGLFLSFLIYSSTKQIKIWENSYTLWSHVIDINDRSTVPFWNRGNYLRSKKMFKEAIEDYSKAIALKNEHKIYNSRARLYFDMAGNDTSILRKGLEDYNKAIALDSTDGEYWINRGAAYGRFGEMDKAIENFNRGLQLKPNHVSGYSNRSVLYNILADRYPLGSKESNDYLNKSLLDMDTYLQYKPEYADMWYEKAMAYRKLNQLDKAILNFNEAIKINPNAGIYYYGRAIVNYQLKNFDAAKIDLNAAIQNGVNNIDASVKQSILGK